MGENLWKTYSCQISLSCLTILLHWFMCSPRSNGIMILYFIFCSFNSFQISLFLPLWQAKQYSSIFSFTVELQVMWFMASHKPHGFELCCWEEYFWISFCFSEREIWTWRNRHLKVFEFGLICLCSGSGCLILLRNKSNSCWFFLQHYESSEVIFWSLRPNLISMSPVMKQNKMQYVFQVLTKEMMNYVCYVIYYVLVCLMFFLNCFADVMPRHLEYPRSKVW